MSRNRKGTDNRGFGANQPTVGHLSQDSPNAEQRAGRDSGFGPGRQRLHGHKQEDSDGGRLATGGNGEQRRRPWRQVSNTGDLDRGPAPEVTRSDNVFEV